MKLFYSAIVRAWMTQKQLDVLFLSNFLTKRYSGHMWPISSEIEQEESKAKPAATANLKDGVKGVEARLQ